MEKPDIKKFIQKQNQHQNQRISTKKNPNSNPLSQKGSLIDSPLFAMAQGMIENMPTKYKFMIGGAIYLLLAGVVGTGIGIVKLINLIF